MIPAPEPDQHYYSWERQGEIKDTRLSAHALTSVWQLATVSLKKTTTNKQKKKKQTEFSSPVVSRCL